MSIIGKLWELLKRIMLNFVPFIYAASTIASKYRSFNFSILHYLHVFIIVFLIDVSILQFNSEINTCFTLFYRLLEISM